MKVVAVMEVSPEDGGGYYQALNAVLQMKRLSEGCFDFAVATMKRVNMPTLARLGIDSFHSPVSLFEKLQPILFSSRLAERVLCKHVFQTERRLLAAGADLVYFVAPWGRAHVLRHLTYWATVWDLAHLDHAEFPEVFGSFHVRERLLRQALCPAALILADSTELTQRVCHRYGISPAHVVAMPFAPAPLLSRPECRPRDEVLRSFGLEPGYLFYPAQFWAHKNHVRVLEALRLCRDRGHHLRIVFAGGNMGGRTHVEAKVQALELQDQVRFLGFVDERDMRGLYEGSLALVMPTYFGPTNLPPLEAWSLGVPVIYSSHLREQAGDAALLVDPDDAAALADAMLAVRDSEVRAGLVTRGQRRLEEIRIERSGAERLLLDRLQRLQVRLRCSPRPAV